MAFTDIDATKPTGTEKMSTADNYIRELKTDVETNLAEISGYPDISATKVYEWTTATRPTGASLKTMIHGYNSTTGFYEHYNGTEWVVPGLSASAVQALIDAATPIGGIIMWSGSIATIPSQWHLCDGTEGTPDLLDRFIVGAGDSYVVGATGGENLHTLTEAELPPHTHVVSLQALNSNTDVGYGKLATGNASAEGTIPDINTGSTGGGTAFENRPPYYALAYIMRIS